MAESEKVDRRFFDRLIGDALRGMPEDETLTDEERAMWESASPGTAANKVLRLYDQQRARIAELERELHVTDSSYSGYSVKAETHIQELESLLSEAANCMGIDAVDVVERIDKALGKAPG